jgi:hypothetical protein
MKISAFAWIACAMALPAADLANAATVGTASAMQGAALLLSSTNTTGSESGTGSAVLDDAGTLTLTTNESGSILGETFNDTETVTFSGVYSNGTFDADGDGTLQVENCSGAIDFCALIQGTTFAAAVGGGEITATGGTLSGTMDGFFESGMVGFGEHFTVGTSSAVPLPPAVWLFVSGLLGLARAKSRAERPGSLSGC